MMPLPFANNVDGLTLYEWADYLMVTVCMHNIEVEHTVNSNGTPLLLLYRLSILNGRMAEL